MKKILFYSMIIILISLYGCKSNPCKDIQTYPKLDPRMTNYFFKVGSYWVYRDSVDGITDSQYVYANDYRIHYRNPADTPNKLYLTSGISGQPTDIYCGPYYLDNIEMRVISFQNGVIKDTISLYATSSGDGKNAIIYEKDTAINGAVAIAFYLDWSKLGFLDCCFTQGTSTGTWYEGTQSTTSSGNYVFNNINIWRVQIGSSPHFDFPTDLYITSGYGIIKMIQHKPSVDVKWDLINYHVIN